jgi:hypothetical protein
VWRDSVLYLRLGSYIENSPVSFRTILLSEQSIGHSIGGFLSYGLTSPEGDRALSCAFCAATVSRAGRPIVTAPDTQYRILELDSTGAIIKTWMRRGVAAIRLSRSESAVKEHRLRYLPDGTRVPGEPPKMITRTFKHRFAARGLGLDSQDRIWALVNSAEGRPTSFDLFESSGPFLGRAIVPEHLVGFELRNNHLIGGGETPDGEPVVYLYTLSP